MASSSCSIPCVHVRGCVRTSGCCLRGGFAVSSCRTRLQTLLACRDPWCSQHISCCTSTAGVHFVKCRQMAFLSLFANLWLSGESLNSVPQLVTGSRVWELKWWSGFPSSQSFVFLFGAEAEPFPGGQWQQVPCRTQPCHGGVISVWLPWPGGIPQGWILSCPAEAEAPAETVLGFFYPNASFRSCNLKPVVTSSPMLIFLTNFGWVCLYKQINCFEGSLLLCRLYVLEL